MGFEIRRHSLFERLLDGERKFKETSGDAQYILEDFSIPIPKEEASLCGTKCSPRNGYSGYYYNEQTTKDLIVLHLSFTHTKAVIKALTDESRGHVSASYVLAREGTIYQLFNSTFWSYHLGKGAIGGNKKGSQRSIAIEIANPGYLVPEGEHMVGVYKQKYCKISDTNQYQELEKPFRGQKYFATVTDQQYQSLILLLRYLTAYHDIPREFLSEGQRYTTTKAVGNFKGIVSHTNFRKDKYDIGPAFKWTTVIEGVKNEKLTPDQEETTVSFKKSEPVSSPGPNPLKKRRETLSVPGSNKNYELGGFERKKHTGVQIPTYRRLRGYAFDPSLSIDLETSFINEIVFQINWEGFESAPLGPGPRGEYLEVIDYDPASQCYYEPVDLNAPYILASDGLDPAEGNPQFHQQMVYAVGMTTIQNFEKALGRWAMWSPRLMEMEYGETQKLFVKRLRIYPHALRQANAFYSSQKKALLFGYFPADPTSLDIHIPGGTVFTCLSHDVIAHETAHALLDGMHQGLIEPVHPDNLAFHEAFSDIVALFQHFTFPEVLRHQIAKTRGDLTSESLLGQLAQQVGLAIGNYGALRSAIGNTDPETKTWKLKKPDPTEYQNTFEPHDRGAILVGAVFDAFLAIYNKRVADFKRIASEGTGILRAGDLHPDLVSRLAKEASKTAQHVLNICIRALDYCPPNEISFGDYLRALITADYDLVSDDSLGYRIAFIEAFKRRGIYPRNVRSLSVDSLRWKMPNELSFSDTSFAGQGEEFEEIIEDLQSTIIQGALSASREEVFLFNQELAQKLREKISFKLRDDTWFKQVTGLDLRRRGKDEIEMEGDQIYDNAGFLLDDAFQPQFEVHAVRLSTRSGPQGNTLDQLILSVSQERTGLLKDGLPFRGGATLIIDWKNLQLKYAIKRKIDNAERINEQNSYLGSRPGLSLKETYFTKSSSDEPFMALHTKSTP